MSRNLAPGELLLEHNITDCDAIKLTESCRAVERLSVGPVLKPLPSAVLTKLLQHSPKLKTLDFNGCDKVDKLAYQTIAEKCHDLTELTLQTEDIDIAAMQAIFHSCRKLKKIHITELKSLLHDSVVSSIVEHCSSLTYLGLSPMRSVGVESLQRLSSKCSSLTTLHLTHCTAALREGLLAIAKNCSTLTELNLYASQLDSLLVATFAHNNQRLKKLHLASCRGVGNHALWAVACRCPQLEEIDVSFNNRITDWSVRVLVERCPHLKVLVFASVRQLTDETVTAVAAHCRHLEKLSLANCEQLTPAALSKVALQCTKLVSLDVCVECTNDAVFQKLAIHCPQFVKLSLHDISNLPNPAALYSVSNYLCRLQYFCCATLNSISDTAVLQVVENCPHLRTLIVVRLLMVCQDKRIVKAIARNCPKLSGLYLGRCTEQVARAIVKWYLSRHDRGSIEIVQHVEVTTVLF